MSMYSLYHKLLVNTLSLGRWLVINLLPANNWQSPRSLETISFVNMSSWFFILWYDEVHYCVAYKPMYVWNIVIICRENLYSQTFWWKLFTWNTAIVWSSHIITACSQFTFNRLETIQPISFLLWSSSILVLFVNKTSLFLLPLLLLMLLSVVVVFELYWNEVFFTRTMIKCLLVNSLKWNWKYDWIGFMLKCQPLLLFSLTVLAAVVLLIAGTNNWPLVFDELLND